MKVVFIVRNTFYTQPGGDTVQVTNTAKSLATLGIHADIRLCGTKINYDIYSLLHFFNIIRPADILKHLEKAGRPCIVSPILVDYSEYDKHYRKGVAGLLFRHLPGSSIEYTKTIARWISGKDKLVSKNYLWKGHRKSIGEILSRAAMVLPGSQMELDRLGGEYTLKTGYMIVPNGIDPDLFCQDQPIKKNCRMVLCIGRIEGIKNQASLIKALNNTPYQVYLVGAPAQNQQAYYRYCRRIAAANVTFVNHLPQEQLLFYYRMAKVHVLPSWFETCGLASLEAAATGCNVVLSNRGFSRDYFGSDAYYCDPAKPESILEAVEKAAGEKSNEALRKKIMHNYTWHQTAIGIRNAYNKVLGTK